MVAIVFVAITCFALQKSARQVFNAVNRERWAASAPAATALSPAIRWAPEMIQGWHYSLVSTDRIANFGFASASTATASIGGPPTRDAPHLGIKAGDPSMMEVSICGVYWSINLDGELLLTEPDSDYSARLRLVYIDDRIASVWNATLGESEKYIRTP